MSLIQQPDHLPLIIYTPQGYIIKEGNDTDKNIKITNNNHMTNYRFSKCPCSDCTFHSLCLS